MMLRSSAIHPFMTCRAKTFVKAFGALLIVSSATAQAQTWQVDSHLSVARIGLGSAPNMVEIGLARISGQVVFNPDHPANSTFALKIAPGDDTGSQSVAMSFRSKQAAITSDGTLIVTGNLAVTRVERSTTMMEPSEAFSGAVYGDQVVHTAVHPVTLVFQLPRNNAALPATAQLSGTTSVARRDFPQLLDAITLADWPTELVNGRHCTLPLTFGEDYAGAKCTGTLIASVSNAEKSIGTGEAFSGFRPAVEPDFDRGTITMDVTLSELKPAPSSVPAPTIQRASISR